MAKERQCLKEYENYGIVDLRIIFKRGQIRQAISAIAKISPFLTWAALLAAGIVSPASAQPPASARPPRRRHRVPGAGPPAGLRNCCRRVGGMDPRAHRLRPRDAGP